MELTQKTLTRLKIEREFNYLKEKLKTIRRLGDVQKKANIYLKGISFMAQRNNTIGKWGVIPFNMNPLNVGGGFNTSAGTFTAPVNGSYHFYFSGAVDFHLKMFLNMTLIDSAFYSSKTENSILWIYQINSSDRENKNES